MYRSTASLDGHDGVESPYGSLKKFEMSIFVGEHPEFTRVYPKTNTRVYVLLRGLKPGVTLSLVCHRQRMILGIRYKG